MSKATLLAVVSDLHCGGTTAMCPPAIRLDDGGHYAASTAQQWLWQSWIAFWDRAADLRAEHDADLIEIFNGDLVEGDHHRTTQILSGNPTAQAAVVDACMTVPLALCPDQIAIVRGTMAHVGESASTEESIAKGLRKDKRPIYSDPETGTASHWHLRMNVDGVRVDVTHHGRTGQREHTRGGAAVLHAHDILLSHVKNGDDYPHLCLRGHYHKFNDSYDAAPTRVITTGAWQLGTGHVHKVAPDSLADIGGALVVIKDGSYTVEKVQYRAQRSPAWEL